MKPKREKGLRVVLLLKLGRLSWAGTVDWLRRLKVQKRAKQKKKKGQSRGLETAKGDGSRKSRMNEAEWPGEKASGKHFSKGNRGTYAKPNKRSLCQGGCRVPLSMVEKSSSGGGRSKTRKARILNNCTHEKPACHIDEEKGRRGEKGSNFGKGSKVKGGKTLGAS